jgi:hypothetical protein
MISHTIKVHVQQQVRSFRFLFLSYLKNIFLLAVCDFESSDLCGYVNDPTNTVDWRRVQAGTEDLAPSVDVTYSSSHGHFMSLHTQNTTGRVNGRLVTPSYPDTSASCIRWYMLVENQATLRVRTYAFGTLNPTVLYTTHGAHGNKWKLAHTTVRSSSPYQVVFEGQLNNTLNSSDSVAIDDVSVRSGACDELGTCDFERGLCGFQNLEADFDWKRTSYDIEFYNAPQFDHTTNGRGGLIEKINECLDIL